jgi:hypothetical protein
VSREAVNVSRSGSSWLALLAALAWAGCGAPQAGDRIAFDREADGWDDARYGCVPRGEVRQVRGVLRTLPFGKGTDGTVLEVDGGDAWIVDYKATAQHRELAGRTVVATGRACDKQGASVVGRHFDIATVSIVR